MVARISVRTFTVPEYFLSFLINDQCSGLTQEDFDQFKDFIEREEIDESLGHWSYDEFNEPYFSWDNDITSQGSTVVDIEWVEID
jgi:hypothetical protein